ncbi:hypothetical protein [Vreelandella sp. H-I2]
MDEINIIIESIKNSPIIWFLSTIVAAFAAGFAARGVVDKPVKREDLKLNKDSEVDIVQQLDLGIRNFFTSQSWYDPNPGQVMGEAKGIARKLQSESNVFKGIEDEINYRKKHDNNWTYANRLQAGLDLVHALGLSGESVDRNKIFINMTLPPIQPKEAPKK